MFERYTEKARRVIFFARYEASQLGHDQIGDAHLLLGLMREDAALFLRLLPNYESQPDGWTFESVRRKIVDAAGRTGERISTSVDMPISPTGKRVLAYAAEEAERLGHKHLGTEHILLGLSREQDSLAATILRDIGMDVEKVRSRMVAPPEPPPRPEAFGGHDSPRMIGSRAIPKSVIEFICDGKLIASVVATGSPLPRAGDRIVLNDKGAEAAFHVEEATYVYERYPPDMVVAPHRLAKVVIRVRRDQPT